MRLLLDTHAFLWWMADDPRLGPAARAAIRNPENGVYLSAASVWEMHIKVALGRLRVPEPASTAARRLGLEPLDVNWAHAEASAALPPLHKDPFDRLLIAQAQIESLTLVTNDPAIQSYRGIAWLSG